MALTKEFAAHLEDLFSVLPGSSVRRMFGGAGIFRDGLMYALSLDDGRIALKADEENLPAFLSEDMEEWTYPYKGGQKSMGYWYMPERLADEPDELEKWARASFEAAMRADARKPASQRKLKR
ncbi:MAG: TfoX/Sxy family protein [Rhizobiaceae bacterium]